MMKRGHSRNGHPAARFFAGIQAPGARFTRTTAWGATSDGKKARKTSVLRLDDRKMLDASLPTLPPTIGEGSERQGRVQPWIENEKKGGRVSLPPSTLEFVLGERLSFTDHNLLPPIQCTNVRPRNKMLTEKHAITLLNLGKTIKQKNTVL